MPSTTHSVLSRNAEPHSHREKTGARSKEYETESAMFFCVVGDCNNHKNLKTCKRCRSVHYCSKECQKHDWKNHKAACNHNFEVQNGSETVFQQNLRHWLARLHATLLMACIRALQLRHGWDHIDEGAIVIFLEPRPHINKGARWRIRFASLFSCEEIYPVLEKLGALEGYRDKMIPSHNEARQRLRKSGCGESDYAAVIAITSNSGPDALEGDHPSVSRFESIQVYTVGRKKQDQPHSQL
ncbi:MYND-type domain-containing protein [Favolaschia claudopus]|uniref:MYND-type domain-containing protein n=1 Tax=Favolaschia claudopus TaxID=2862362 RepID=A0AAW0BKK5_9AGAR